MATTQTQVNNSGWTSLGAGPLLISATDKIFIGVGAAQPAAGVVGHLLEFSSVPFYSPFAGIVWAMAAGAQTNPTVTTSTTT